MVWGLMIPAGIKRMWFTEDPWPPIVAAGLAAVFFLFNWVRSGKTNALLIGVVCLTAMVGIFFLEQAIVTEPERIEQLVVQLADSVVAGDTDQALSYISKQSRELGSMVAGAMLAVTIEDDLSITDTTVEMLAQGSRAKIRFRANGTVNVKAAGLRNHYPSRWEVIWQRESGEWKIIKVVRLNIINGQEIGLLSGG